MTLVNQPTAAPSRKWWAGLIAGVIVNAAYGAADYLWPGHPFEPYKGEAIGWAVLAVTLVTQYFSRNRASEPVEQPSALQKLGDGSGSQLSFSSVWAEAEEAREVGTGKQASKTKGAKT